MRLGRFRRVAAAGVVLVLAWLGVAGAAGAAPALWRVKGDHAEIYLFGTLHALPPNLAWRTPAYDAAYAEASTVWFEASMDGADPKTMQAMLLRYGMDPGRRLSQKLAPDALAQLERQADLRRIDHLRPWAAALMLSMQPMLSRGAKLESGADATMTRAARGEAKTIRTFETVEDQVRVFASLPEGAEVRYLTEVIREHAPRAVRPAEASAESLEQAWMDGDLARLGPALVGGMKADNPSLYDALLKRRNLAWADQIAGELKGAAGVELVNVGALHMVGDDGLPALLQARGFTVERVQ